MNIGFVWIGLVGRFVAPMGLLPLERMFALLIGAEISRPFIKPVPIWTGIQKQNPKHKRERGCVAGLHG
jgi:hypothetical protein